MYEKMTAAELSEKAREAMQALEALKAEQAARATKAEERFNKVLDKIKSLILESGVKGKLVFEISENNDVTWKITKASKSGKSSKSGKARKNGKHLTKEIKDKLDTLLSGKKVPEMVADNGNVRIGELEITATQLGEYGILCIGRASSAELHKMFPVLRVSQCNGITLRWQHGNEAKVMAELS